MTEGFSKTGIYMRLSRDDEKAGESMSIEHQRMILQKYIAERRGTIIDEYVDDGWSGTSFERPAVKKMLEDVQTGKIDTVVVKDLSRFGRNYIQVGQYIDYIFPAYGIRFVAISDNIDTADRCSAAMDMMPIMNVFNEWHAANTSKKIRAVLEASQRAGKYTNWNYSYGYRAGTDENRTAVIDEEAARVVRSIFEMRAAGNSIRTIAIYLTDIGVSNPTAYYTKLDGGKSIRANANRWSPETVRRILCNPLYIGNVVQHKTTRVSYKNHKAVSIPESERIVKQNAHAPIIGAELWERVQGMGKSVSRGKADKSNKVHALSGLLVCADCGKKLKLKTYGKCRCSFACRTYIDLGKKYCTAHSISEEEIEGIVLRDMRSMLKETKIDEEKLRNAYLRERAKSAEQSRGSDERNLKAYQTRLAELEKLIQSAFEEKVLGSLPEAVCRGLCEKYQKEKISVEEEIAKIKNRLAEAGEGEEDADEYIKRVKAYVNCEKLTREACLQLIEFITVGERGENGAPREIKIYYRLCGES
ncbi:MAG: recombinase family protein [Clostridia bacterium]|nr:recombinase family protein [Clostridia bacterium]